MNETNPARELSLEETKIQLLRHFKHLVNYWENDSRAITSKEKLDGLLFSICSTLDGENIAFPAFAIIPLPNKNDKEFNIKTGKNYFPYTDPETLTNDIGGLHEYLNMCS